MVIKDRNYLDKFYWLPKGIIFTKIFNRRLNSFGFIYLEYLFYLFVLLVILTQLLSLQFIIREKETNTNKELYLLTEWQQGYAFLQEEWHTGYSFSVNSTSVLMTNKNGDMYWYRLAGDKLVRSVRFKGEYNFVGYTVILEHLSSIKFSSLGEKSVNILGELRDDQDTFSFNSTISSRIE